MKKAAALADPISDWFARFQAERAAESADFRARVKTHLEAGGIVREFGLSRPVDWRVRPDDPAERIADHLDNRRQGFGFTHEFLPAETLRVRKAPPCGSIDLLTLRTMLAADGYTHAISHGGPIPLSDWTPYGCTNDPLDPDGRDYYGRLYQDAEGPYVVDASDADTEPSPFFVDGVWRFSKEGTKGTTP